MGVLIGGLCRCFGWKWGPGGPLVRPADQIGWTGGQVSWLHRLWVLDTAAPTFLDTLAKWNLKGRQHLAGRPAPIWLGWARAFAKSSPHVIFYVTMPCFGHIEDMHRFWSIWCFSIIGCSWNGRSTKLVELISNKYLSSICSMKCTYVGGKYVHFMTANTLPVSG
jgi:hypothetical protein